MPGFHLRAQPKGKFRRVAVVVERNAVVAVVASALSLSFSSGGCNEVGGPVVTGWCNTNRRTLPRRVLLTDIPTYVYICMLGLGDVRLSETKETRRARERVVKTEGAEGKWAKGKEGARTRDEGSWRGGDVSREPHDDHGSIHPWSSTLGPTSVSSLSLSLSSFLFFSRSVSPDWRETRVS